MANAALVAAEAFKLGVSVDHVSSEREVWACACPTRWPDTDTSAQKLGRMVETFALAQMFPAGFTFDIDSPPERGVAWMLTMRWCRGIDIAAVAAWFEEFQRVDRVLHTAIPVETPCVDACFACLDKPELGPLDNPAEQRYILCRKCGCKRCPHATDHRNACTGSNEPGQEGSRY